MKNDKSQIPAILGIVLIVAGGLSVVVGLVQSATTIAQFSLEDLLAQYPGMEELVQEEVAAYGKALARDSYHYTIVMLLVHLLLSIGAIGAGAQLRLYRSLGRRSAQYWALAALVYLGTNVVGYLTYVAPLTSRLAHQHFEEQVAQQIAITSPFGTFLGYAFSAILPIVTLALLAKKQVKACCRA